MPEITFDSTDDLDIAEERQANEAKFLELGEKLQAEEEASNQRKYDQAREDAESELRYAGKFKSAEDLEKAYKELEKKLGQKDESSSDNEPTQEEGDDTSEEGDDEDLTQSEEAQAILKASEEYYSNDNQLSPETVQKLKELHGVTGDLTVWS